MHFNRKADKTAISDCGHYSITKVEPIKGCFFISTKHHPDKDYRVGVTLGQFFNFMVAKSACVKHKEKNRGK